MAYNPIDNGSFDNDPTAEKIRLAFGKANGMFEELYDTQENFPLVSEIFLSWPDSGAPELEQVAAAVNAAVPDIVVPEGTLQVISFVSFFGVSSTSPYYKRMYLLKFGPGTYGNGSIVAVNANNFIALAPISVGTDTVTTFALGDIGTTAIHTYVNNNGTYEVVGPSVFTATISGSEKVYLFSGPLGLYGLGESQTTEDNFIDLSTQEYIPEPIDFLPPKEIASTPYEITTDDLNRLLVFTSNDQEVTIDGTLAELAAEAGIQSIRFRAYFTGSGTHTVTDPVPTGYDYAQFAKVDVEAFENDGNGAYVLKEIAGGGGGATSVTRQTEITSNTTINGTRKGLNNVYPINSDSAVKVTVDKGTYAVGDVVNFKWLGDGAHTVERGTNVRLEGKRAIDNIHRRANEGNYASLIFDRLDGSVLVGAVIGDIQGGYTGKPVISSMTDIREGETGYVVTVNGSGFSENMIVTSDANATINGSFTYVSPTQITLDIDVVGSAGEDVVFTFDNGQVTEYTAPIVAYAVPVLADYAIYLKWEDNMNDSGSNANNGTTTAITYDADGNVGKSAIFAGGENYGLVPHDNSLSFGDGTTDSPFTIVDTVKFEATDTQFLITKDNDPSTGREYRILYLSGKITFVLYDQSTGGNLYTEYTFTPTLGQWYHFMFVYDGATQPKIFVNNVEVGTANNSGTYVAMENGGGSIKYGAQGTAAFSNSHDGERDESAIFNIEFTEGYRNWAYDKFVNREALL